MTNAKFLLVVGLRILIIFCAITLISDAPFPLRLMAVLLLVTQTSAPKL